MKKEKPDIYILETFHFGDDRDEIMTRWIDKTEHDSFESAEKAAMMYMLTCEFIGYKISLGDDLLDSKFDRAGYVAKNMSFEQKYKLKQALKRTNK